MWWNKRRQEACMEAMIEQRITEALQTLWSEWSDNLIDPYADLIDPTTGERWLPLGTGKDADERRYMPADCSALTRIRGECRWLADTNEFAVNGHENRISYIVGSGHVYEAAWKKGMEPGKPAKVDAMEAEGEGDTLVSDVQAVIDEFCDDNRWHQRQQEIVRRKDRDGECFLRFFSDDTGRMRVRFVEPSQIAPTADKANDPANSFGIQTDPDDVETVLGYWVDGNLVDAGEIQHRKANVDANVKRGLPLYFPVRQNLRRAEKLLRNMSVVAEIQASIALIRKHSSATKAGAEQFVAGQASAQVTSQATGQTRNYQRFGAGTILDSRQGIDYEFPASAINAGSFVAILQAELRAIASRLVMPEFMLTSDASNANYSSTMVAEGPAVKMFQRLQFDMIEDDLAVMHKVIEAAVVAGRLPDGVLDRVDINATPPNIQTRDRLKDAQADFILQRTGAISAQTIAERNDLDWEQEAERIEEDNAKADARKIATMPTLGDGQRTAAGMVPFRRDDVALPAEEGMMQERSGNDEGRWVTLDNGEHVLINNDGTMLLKTQSMKPKGSSGRASPDKRLGAVVVGNRVMQYEKNNPKGRQGAIEQGEIENNRAAVAALKKKIHMIEDRARRTGKQLLSKHENEKIASLYDELIDAVKKTGVSPISGEAEDMSGHIESLKSMAKYHRERAAETKEHRLQTAARLLWEGYP